LDIDKLDLSWPQSTKLTGYPVNLPEIVAFGQVGMGAIRKNGGEE
jgi:hypothetical protein